MAGKINVPITTAIQGIANTQRQLSQLSRGIQSVGKTAGIAAIGFATFSAGVKAADFAVQAIQGARDLERNLLGLKSVFEEVTPQMRTFALNAEQMGLSQNEAAKASTFIGSVLKQSGFSIQQTADLTERLVKLGTDLSLTYGYDVQEALMGMTALFRGEYDPIEKFGVAMKQSEINSELAARKLDHLTGAQRRFAEQQIRVELLFQRSQDAQGAFERGAGTLAVEQLKLQSAFNNLRDTVANNLLPALSNATMALGKGLADAEPIIRGTFESLEPIIANLSVTLLPKLLEASLVILSSFNDVLTLLGKLTDPTTKVGDALRDLADQFGSLISTITDGGEDLNVFEILEVTIREASQALTIFLAQIESLIGLLKTVASAVGLEGIFEAESLGTLIVNIGLALVAFRLFKGATKGLDGAMLALTGRFTVASVGAVGLIANLTALRLAITRIPFVAVASGVVVAGVALKDYADEIYGVKTNTEGMTEAQIKQEQKVQNLKYLIGQYEDSLKNANVANKDLAEEGLTNARRQLELIEVRTKGSISELNRFNRIKLDAIQKEIGDTAGEMNRFRNIANGVVFELAPELADDPSDDNQTKEKAKNYVKDFMDNLKEEVQKQTAREQLSLRGASEGLIDAILGSEGWMKVWQQIKSGKIALQDLQDQFYATAAGAKELKDAADKAAKELEEYNEKVARINEQLAEDLKAIAEKATEAKNGFKDLLDAFSILPTIEREIGKFEGQVADYLESIMQSLKAAFDNKDLLEAGYKELQAFARKELALLAEIGRQRDELAERFDLAEGLIKNYKNAFTAALNLTQLFSQLKEETETRTVTSVTRGLVRLGSSMREFEVTVTNSYEETIGKVVNKSQGLLDSFRDLAEKARGFGENLRKLRELGLDPMLFNQLVEAGVEAGGETAKALVEGGQSTIDELNSLFKEIDTIGGTLGEEVATTLYGTGVDLANGLLEGIRSKQKELEDQAIKMAKSFNDAFRTELNLKIDVAASAASDAARQAAADAIAALGPAPEVPSVIDESALAQINSLIAGANRYIKNITDPLKAAGGAQKLNIYESLRADILAGTQVNLAGVRSGLSTAELQAVTGRGTVVNNTYNVNVSSDSRVSGAKAGEAVVESLQKFGQTNGNFTVGVAG